MGHQGRGGSSKSRTPCPRALADGGFEVDESIETEIGWVVDLIGEIRSVKSEMGVPPSTAVPLVLIAPSDGIARSAAAWSESVKRLARVERIETAGAAPRGALQLVVRDQVVALPLGGIVDLRRRERVSTRKSRMCGSRSTRSKLNLATKTFFPARLTTMIAEHEERREAFQERLTKLTHARERLDRL